MREKIKTQKGFIHIPSLIGIIVSIVVIVMIIGYKATSNQKPTITTTVNVTVPSSSTTTIEPSATTTSGSLNTTSTVQEGKTIASSYDYSKLSNKYRYRALYIDCVVHVIKSHEYLDPILKDLDSPNEDTGINAVLKIWNDAGYDSQLIDGIRREYPSHYELKNSLINSQKSLSKELHDMEDLENIKRGTASGFLLTDKVFLTANHVKDDINSVFKEYQQYKEKFYSTQDEENLKLSNFLYDFQLSCYAKPVNSLQKYLIKLPFTELGSDITIGYSDQPIPTDNLQSFSLCKESPKIGSSVYTPSYPGGEFLESFGKILNRVSQVKLITGEARTGDIYLIDIALIPGSSGGGIIVYTNNSDCLFGVNSGGDPNNKLFSGKALSDVTSILPYIDKIKAIMQE